MLALEFIDRDADAAMAEAASASVWLAERRIRSALPPGAERSLAELRTSIESLLRAAACGSRPPLAALDRINAASAGAPITEQLDWPGNAPPRRWSATSAPPEQHVYALLARSAMALVADATALRECQAPRCGRIFVSANARRRWCSTACGTRVRVARHASRRRGPATG